MRKDPKQLYLCSKSPDIHASGAAAPSPRLAPDSANSAATAPAWRQPPSRTRCMCGAAGDWLLDDGQSIPRAICAGCASSCVYSGWVLPGRLVFESIRTTEGW